jgi:hypothetical protein
MKQIDILRDRMAIRNRTDSVTIRHDGKGGVIFNWLYHIANSSTQHSTMRAIKAPQLNRLLDPVKFMNAIIDDTKRSIEAITN